LGFCALRAVWRGCNPIPAKSLPPAIPPCSRDCLSPILPTPAQKATAMPATRFTKLALVLAFLALPLAPAVAQRTQATQESAIVWQDKPPAHADRMMVAASNPLATQAGLEMLRAGGNAVDAAIAAHLVLGLVEPYASGLGGGGFLLHWDAKAAKLSSYDGRETAPAAAKPDRFITDGNPMVHSVAVGTGLSVATPGMPRLLDDVHRAHGRLPWARVFEPALKLAEQGFPVPSRLHRLLIEMPAERFSPAARAYLFGAEGKPPAAGSSKTNPGYAATLKAMRDGRSQGFYAGAPGQEIAAAVASAATPGDLTIADLAAYKAVKREPLCSAYRSYRICGMGPPSSGSITVAQTLALLKPLDLGRGPAAALNLPAMHLIAEAEKLTFADRDHFVADPDFVAVPEGLLDTGYLAQRRGMINAATAMAKPAPGQPPQKRAALNGVDATIENAGTSHMSIIDADGNAVSLTATIESRFGSRLFAAGMMLNNQMTDFSFRARDDQGRAIANSIQPGKRSRSSMAPTMVFDKDGHLVAVLGSPGGGRVAMFIVKALVAMIDWQLDPQAASALVNFGSRGDKFELEADHPTADRSLLWRGKPGSAFEPLTATYGHKIDRDALVSGLHIIARTNFGGRAGADSKRRWAGGADPRPEGLAAGE
jgi:gamma-glutamyltranspeptidase / glutathione hydrolase